MNEKMNELQKIMEQNPDLEVEFMVENSEINPDYDQSRFRIISIEICIWAEGKTGELMTDYDHFISEYEDDFDSWEDAEKAFPIGSLEKCILVSMGAA